jgi:hypothetical protein
VACMWAMRTALVWRRRGLDGTEICMLVVGISERKGIVVHGSRDSANYSLHLVGVIRATMLHQPL